MAQNKSRPKALKNITFSAEETLIERARRQAEANGTTLNGEFRRWLEQYVECTQDIADFRALMARLSYAQPGRAFHRDEMNDFLDAEAAQTRARLDQLQVDLLAFERQYHLSSAEFYQQYRSGKMGDDLDFVEWAALIQMAENAQNKWRLLTEDPA